MVYQGTVFGPYLWNTFFGDSVCAIQRSGFVAVLYADDLNAFKCFEHSVCNRVLWAELRECQRALHRWGQGNQVIFDAGKEQLSIISLTDPEGESLRLLGVVFDPKLQMGLLHRVTLGLAPSQLAVLFPRLGEVTEEGRGRLRGWAPLHNKQLFSHCGTTSTDALRRSLFGLVHTYNSLPQWVVDKPTVKAFQRSLQEALKVYGSAPAAPASWPRLYTEGWRNLSRQDFQGLFA